MQNKGFVRLLAAALLLVCLFYLSFSFVTSHYDKKAKEYAGGSTERYYNYMDSVSGDEVWIGYTLKQCREKEINLGLDLKGGMNVTLEVSVADILRALSGYNTSPAFNEALNATRIRQARSGDNFLRIFKEEFEKIDPNARLSTIFSTLELKDKIQLSTSNDEVIKVLQQEVNSAIDNSFNVLRSRIDRFGVVQPNIQRLDVEGRILVELPGVKEPERVRKLLQGSANLEFWETYKLEELSSRLEQANAAIREINRLNQQDHQAPAVSELETIEQAVEVAEEAQVAETLTDNSLNADSLTQALKALETTEGNAQDLEKYKEEYPLFYVLNPAQNGNGPVLGYATGADTAKVNAMFATRQVREIMPSNLRLSWSVKPVNPEAKQPLFALIALKVSSRDGRAPLEGDVVTDASMTYAQYSSYAAVSMKMNAEGAKTWARLTKENIGREIAIVLDGYTYSYPTVYTEITGGSSEITGQFSVEEAKDLANVLKSGRMPAPARIVQEDVVGPSLGQEAIRSGLISFIIAFFIVLLYMLFYYGIVPGLIADGALLLNVVFLFGILASFNAVLTLPGIAGIVLTLGTAVDANVLIYERIREELRAGKNFKKAIKDGYGNAFSAILDANVTTLITGVILFYFGTGPIKGFATTLIIGIITSFFTAVFITRLVYERIMKSDKNFNITFTTKITKNWFQNTNFDFIKARKMGYIISGSIIAIAIISLSVRGLSQGIDFSGGRNYVVRFEQPVSAEDVREVVSNVFPGAQTSVITMGANNQLRITTNYEINSLDDNIDSQMETMLFNALKDQYNDQITQQMFVERFTNDNGVYRAPINDTEMTYGIQSSQKVGPTIADDIKTSAVWSILLSLIAIALYILIRFRNYAFSVGAIVALIHDVLFILAVYSIFYSIMPFSLEIDQAFIAAILTVIGYSINDTVVIFDRIRENMVLFPKRNPRDLINMSLNSTLSRTFSTSFSTALVLLTIFIFGGEVIRGFVFALLLGVFVGTYSTLFVATPVSYELRRRQMKLGIASCRERVLRLV